jgi:iron complex transport system substrate-binding protein
MKAAKTQNTRRRLFFSALFLCLLALPDPMGLARQVVDQLNRAMQIADNPRRVIALAPSITEIIFALHQEQRLVGVTLFSDYPPAAQKLPKVGSYVQLDIEKIVSLKPDLCIGIRDGNPIALVKRLESLGIPVYAVNPTNLESVMTTVDEIGGLLGSVKQARQLTAEMHARVQVVESRIAAVRARPRVFFQIGISPIVSAGTHTFIHELIHLSGGVNIAAGPVNYPRYTEEEVIRLKPDIIIITSMARGVRFDSVKARWLRWKSIPAVRHDRIYLVDSNLVDRPSPRLVKGLEDMARMIHPEVFGNPP